MADWTNWHPIPAETLPARFEGVFKTLDTTYQPADDELIVRTITGENLELATKTTGRSTIPVWHAGYQRAIWELREGHLRWCPTQDRLWRRDADETDHAGPRHVLNSWHPVKTLEDEYRIGSNGRDGSANRAVADTILREAKRAQWFKQVERGVRIDPCVWLRQDGHVVCLRDHPDIAVTQTFDVKGMGNAAVAEAERLCRWLTADEKSARNLLRMFATPWLEPFKQFTYILSGHGGDGKSLIGRQILAGVLGLDRVYPGFDAAQYCAGGGYTLARESMNDAMDGKAFAYSDETPTITENMLPALRALSTGSQTQARVTGGRYRTITPTATIILLTNQPFADSSEPSDRRRFIKVEMHPNTGRTYDQYHAVELFAKEHPAAFYAASCRLWEQGDEPETVNLAPARTLSDETWWIVSEILENEEMYGQPVASRDKFRDEFRHPIDEETMNLLGLKNGATKVFPNSVKSRVVRVEDEERFDIYRRMAASETEDETTRSDVDALAMPGPDTLTPIEDIDDCHTAARLTEEWLQGECGFAPCEGKRKGDRMDEKVSTSWRRLNPDTEHHTTANMVRLDWPRYALIPLGRTFVIDCDQNSQAGAPHGFQLLQQAVGEYGGSALPRTLAVRSPHGLHLYYRLPADYPIDMLKNAVHQNGLPIDLRVSGKGYVVGPGSRANGGAYRIVDTPNMGTIPEAPARLLEWLDQRGYVEHPLTPQRQPALPDVHQLLAQPDPLPRRTNSRNGRPDMTPIPEGSRNDTLHAWAYGRAANHRDNWRQIEADLYERGRNSGLRDNEIATIWASIMRQLGGR